MVFCLQTAQAKTEKGQVMLSLAAGAVVPFPKEEALSSSLARHHIKPNLI